MNACVSCGLFIEGGQLCASCGDGPGTTPRLADTLYDAQRALWHQEERFMDFLEACGIPDTWDDVTFDPDDRSFELKGVAPEFRWAPDQLAAVWVQGFERFWLCHRDGTESIYRYGATEPERQLRPSSAAAAWVAVDLDGTLAEYGGWRGVGHIGAPVPAMVARVKAWLAEGREVRIFTARVWDGAPAEAAAARAAVERWCEEHLGRRLAVTATKDWNMVELWDDRAIQVVFNTGRRADGES